MQVILELDELDPPEGTARINDEEKRIFAGWLGLLHVLAELTTAPAKS